MSKWRVLFSVYKVPTIPRKFIKDLLQNPRVMFFHKHGKIIWLAHIVLTYFIFGPVAIAVNFLIIFYSYIGYGVLNTFGHDSEGPVNRFWISLIAPFEGQHRDHHERSHTKS
jgi:amino acid transporter